MDKLRDFLKSWPGRIMLMLCLLPMVLLGLEGYLQQGQMTPNQVARVGDNAIDLHSLQAESNATRERLIQTVDGSAIDDKALNRQTLDTMINRALLEEQAKALGMQVSDNAIQAMLIADPAFADASGNFSNDVFARFLQSRGMTKDMLFASQRRELNLRQLMNSILTNAIYTTPQVNRLMNLQSEARPIWVKRLSWQNYASQVSVSDGEIETYYNENKDKMVSPNMVDLAYIELTPESLPAPTVSDEELKTAYANHLKDNSLGQKQLAQILLTGDKAKEATAIKAELDAGKDFAELAKAKSDDPSGESGGDIGTYNSAVFGDDASKVDAVIATLDVGQVSEPVVTSFGTHIFKVTKADPAPSLDELKETLTKEVIAQKQATQFDEKISAINALVADSYGIKDIAGEMKLAVKELPNYKDKGQDVLGQPAIIKAAFDETTIADGTVSPNIDLGGTTLWVQPSNFRPSAPMDLATAKDQIKELLTIKKASELALKDAQAQAQAVSKDGLADFTEVGMTTRQNPVFNESERASLFATPVKDGDEIVGWAVQSDTGASVIVGGKIETASSERMSDTEKTAAATMIKSVVGQDYLEDYLHYLKEVHTIEINDEALKTL